MTILFCNSLAGGGLFKKRKKRKLQPQIFAGVWCLLLTPFQKRGRGDVSSLPLLQCEFSAYVPDNLNHLLHKGEQQEGYLGTWDNDGILKHLAGWHSRSNTKWSSDNFSLRSTGALLSLGSRSSFLAKAGSCQKGLLPYWSTSEPLKGEGNFSGSVPKGKRGQLPIEYIFARQKSGATRLYPGQKACMSWKTEFKWLFCMPLTSQSPRVPDFVHLLFSLCLLGLLLKKNLVWNQLGRDWSVWILL